MGEPITIQLNTDGLRREIDRLTAKAEKRIAAAKANSDSQVILDGVAKMAGYIARGDSFRFEDCLYSDSRPRPYILWYKVKGQMSEHGFDGYSMTECFARFLEHFK